MVSHGSDPSENDKIPTYQIDLSLPPRERYKQLATDCRTQMQALAPLFDEVLASAIPWHWVRSFVEFLASIFLLRVFSKEETEELRGISEAVGVKLYLLVAFNVLLDSLLGCTSGGVLVTPKERKRKSKGSSEEIPAGQEDRMMHFRTMDWTMEGLRSVIVILEFVRSDSEEPKRVIARSVTWAGFTGCLTGVRKNLSLSLNFRPVRHCKTSALRWHQVMVLFGFRQSIASVLRSSLLNSTSIPLEEITTTLSTAKSAPCYLVLCSGATTSVIEKDLQNSHIRNSDSFIVQTNHDVAFSTHGPPPQKSNVLGLEVLLEESEERRQCVSKKWESLVNRKRAKLKDERPSVRESTLEGWVRTYPVMNEITHFGCIMDPGTGTVRWIERGVLDVNTLPDMAGGNADPESLEMMK